MDCADRDDKLARWWKWLCFAALAYVVATALHWSGRHPIPIHWDESEYVNASHRDLLFKAKRGWPGFAWALLNNHNYRPPAYRLLTLPITITLGPDVIVLRLASLAMFLVAAWILYRAVASVSSPSAGWLAATVFGCSCGMNDAVRWYGTEFASYLAITGSIWLIFRMITQPAVRHRIWIALGITMAMGALSKLSFPWIVGPMFVVVLILAIAKRVPWAVIAQLAGATALAALLAAPWYVANFDKYMKLAKLSQGWDRSPVAGSRLQVFVEWLRGINREGFGWVLTLYLLLCIVVGLAALIRQRSVPRPAWLAMVICLGGAIPFPLMQLFFSVNHTARIITPALICAIAAIAILVGSARLLRWRAAVVVTGIAVALQLLWVVRPWNTHLQPQWDLSPLANLPGLRESHKPTIGYLGMHPSLNPESIATPFLKNFVDPMVFSLWSYGQPLNWNDIHSLARQMDAVVVVPDYDGQDGAKYKFDRDNEYNRVFDQWLRDSGHFQPPQTFMAGRRPVYKVYVYYPKRGATTAPTATP